MIVNLRRNWGAQEELEGEEEGQNDVNTLFMYEILNNTLKLKKKKNWSMLTKKTEGPQFSTARNLPQEVC